MTFLTIVSIIISFITILFGFIGLRFIRERIDSNTWPLVKAKVTDIVLRQQGGGEGNPSYFRAFLKLSYIVEGMNYSKLHPTAITSLYTSRKMSKKEKKENLIEKSKDDYPIGSDFVLYYKPKNPKKAIHKNGLYGSSRAFSQITIALIIISLLSFILDYFINYIYDFEQFLPYLEIQTMLLILAFYFYITIKKELYKGFQLQGGPKENPYTKSFSQTQENLTEDLSLPNNSFSSSFESSQLYSSSTCNRCGSMIKKGDKSCRDCGNILS